ncbi:MAG TPA: response regulator [Oscillatoriaceae cyanobacterium M33_DOE_052]|uniref:histidine kinase n=1 Tax=Planktothricoides sp. SpSt-374 TaxID=2282167 RepID=A0A7C3VJM2_9CYAN|nr:response regulator [Oscillatoriaceae cyanobacterium M33_DOE_052]
MTLHFKLLIVEDEMIIAEDMAESLRRMGYEVPVVVPSGEMAIAKAAEIQPDLVLMDINLQGDMDGIETAALIRAKFQIPVIFLTAYADVPTLERAKQAEPFGYLLKPFEERELQTTIEIAIKRNQAEATMRVSLKKEQELTELKSRFMTMAAHDFRTPLTTIQTSTELLQNYGHKWPEEKKHLHYNRIKNAITMMTKLLDDVLFVGKEEAGKLEFNPQPLDLQSFCGEIIEEIQQSDRDSHPILFEFSGDCQTATMDEQLLRQILTNLLSNAMKYSPPGSPVRFQLQCQDQQARFQIQDSGIGISAEDQQRLFEPFYRAKNVGNISGTGLGLAIVKKCTEVHHGTLIVHSEIGTGTTFTVVLPLVSEDESPRF